MFLPLLLGRAAGSPSGSPAAAPRTPGEPQACHSEREALVAGLLF